MTFIPQDMTPAGNIRRKGRNFSADKIVFTLDERGNPIDNKPQAMPRGGYYPYKFDGGLKGMAFPGMILDIKA